MFTLGKNLLKYRENNYYFCNYIFRKFEIIVCFAPVSYGVERNTFLNFDSIIDSVKSKTWNTWRRKDCNEEAKRIGETGRVVLACKSDEEGTMQCAPSSPPTRFTRIGRLSETQRRLQIWDHCSCLVLGQDTCFFENFFKLICTALFSSKKFLFVKTSAILEDLDIF